MTFKNPHARLSDKYSDREWVWKLFEKVQIRRERAKRIRDGVIVPEYGMKPQLMVKNAQGEWVPEIKVYPTVGGSNW